MRIFLCLLMGLLSHLNLISEPLTSETKKKAEEVINHCEELYAKVVKNRKRLVHKHSALYLRTFDQIFFEFAKITSEKLILDWQLHLKSFLKYWSPIPVIACALVKAF